MIRVRQLYTRTVSGFSGVVSGYAVAGQEGTGGKPAVMNIFKTFVGCRCLKVGGANVPGALPSCHDLRHILARHF